MSAVFSRKGPPEAKLLAGVTIAHSPMLTRTKSGFALAYRDFAQDVWLASLGPAGELVGAPLRVNERPAMDFGGPCVAAADDVVWVGWATGSDATIETARVAKGKVNERGRTRAEAGPISCALEGGELWYAELGRSPPTVRRARDEKQAFTSHLFPMEMVVTAGGRGLVFAIDRREGLDAVWRDGPGLERSGNLFGRPTEGDGYLAWALREEDSTIAMLDRGSLFVRALCPGRLKESR
jgi:hypothetical protein